MLYSLFTSCKINIIDPIVYEIMEDSEVFYLFAICGVSQFCRFAISKLNVYWLLNATIRKKDVWKHDLLEAYN
ncbi:hypothetical protein [Aquimarina algiphila]|uniref:hypothetical protein n=1 Tax=Aquimarina algiphila TaxID=2047982 RepID=UPI0024922BF4|nr:hypothetical protein [Aquimarina algiphila]